MYQEPGIVYKVLEYSDDYTVIEIAMPADFPTVTVATIKMPVHPGEEMS
jgi:hypothetical protein